jgi:electron transfer flavoprotein beta subunit
MKIVVILRQVLDLVEPLEIVDSETSLDYDGATFVVNESDDHALEQALLLKEADEADITALGFDFGEIDNTLYAAAAKGADRVVKIPFDGDTPPSSLSVAAMLAEVIGPIEPDVVLVGCQAHDELDGALGPLLAARMGRPYVGVTRGVEVGDATGTLRVYKEFPGAVKARIAVTLPAVLGVLAAEKPPRYVPVSRIRAAMKSATLEEVETGSAALEPGFVVRRMYHPEATGHAEMLEGSEEDVAARIVEILAEKGVAS